MSAITIDGDLIHYEKLGRGRPVILIHGWLGSWRYWIPLMQQLHLKYSVYTLDLLGFGDSAKNAKKYTVEDQVLMLDKFMDRLGITKAAFIGHGLGALMLTNFTLKYPAKVHKMLLISAPLFDPGDLDERIPAGQSVLLTQERNRYSLAPSYDEDTIPSGSPSQQGSSFNDLPTIGRIDPVDRQRLLERAKQLEVEREKSGGNGKNNPLMTLFNNRSMADLLEKCFKRNDPVYEKMKPDIDKSDSAVLMHSAKGFDAGSYLDNLRRISQPILAVHGKADPLIANPTDAVWQYLTLNRDDNFIPLAVEGAKHFPMLEYEPFTRLTTDFLSATDLSQLAVRERWRRRSR